MAATANLKTTFTSDTKGFEKGAKTVKQGLKDLDKTGTTALNSIGGALGLNTSQLSQMSSAVMGLGTKLRDCGNVGGKAIGSLITSMGGLAAGIAGLGIVGAIAGFKQLSAAADNFADRIDNLNRKLAFDSWKGTYEQAMLDAVGATSSFWYDLEQRWQTGKARGLGMLGTLFTTGSIKETIAADKQASALAAQAAEYGSQIAEAKKQQITNSLEIAQNEAKIVEYERIARDTTASQAERAAAIASATELINRNYTLTQGPLAVIAKAQQSIDNLASNTVEDTQRTVGLQIELSKAEAQREQQLKNLDRIGRSLKTSATGTAQALETQSSALSEILSSVSKLNSASAVGVDMSSPLGKSLSQLSFENALGRKGAEVKIPATIDPEVTEETEEAVHDVARQVASLVEDAFASVGESLGGLIGDLATGGQAWENFSSTALSALGDMAIMVGKVAIETGVATLSIKAALKSLNGWAAIAAGTALVALGSAVKSGLSNASAGSYSSGVASSSVASSGYGTSSMSSLGREMRVTVSGTLVADGNKLVAVINNENNRKSITS